MLVKRYEEYEMTARDLIAEVKLVLYDDDHNAHSCVNCGHITPAFLQPPVFAESPNVTES